MADSVPVRRLPVLGFLAGTGISILGNVMAVIAIPWFVLETTGSASQTGFTGVAAALPAALSGMLGGPLIDRLGGRRMSILADIVSALAVVMIPILYHLDVLTYPLILTLVFLGACLDIPGVTARRMLLPAFQRQAGLRAEQMNSAFESMGNGINMIGPVVAGVLVAIIGPVNLLWITCVGFLISALGVTFLAPTSAADEVPSPRVPYLESIREGVRFILSVRVLVAMAVLFGVSNGISNGFFSVGLPVFAFETWGSAARLGLLFSMLGLGNLLGVLVYGTYGHRLRQHRRFLLLIGFCTQPLWLAPFLFTDAIWILMVAMFLSGFSVGPVNPMSVTVRFEHIPKVLQGRVFATFSAITATVTPLGIAVSGLVIERFGLQTGLGGIVLIYAVMAAVLPLVPAFADMNTPGPFAEPD